jgi:hypothetical protein
MTQNELDAYDAMRNDRDQWMDRAERLERERDELRAKYAMHHAEAERMTEELRSLRCDLDDALKQK